MSKGEIKMNKLEKEVKRIINELKNGEREFIDLSDDNFFIENELDLLEILDVDEGGDFLDLLELELEEDEEIKKISNKIVKREWYRGQYVNFTEAGYTLVYMLPETYEKYNGDVETFNESFGL